jgi:hypothetical protein
VGRFDGILERTQQWGFRRALYWQLMNVLRHAIGLRLHYVLVGSGSGRLGRIDPPEVPERYSARMVNFEDLLHFVGKVPDLSRDFLEVAFSRGDICVASFFDNELVGFSFQSQVRAQVSAQLEILAPAGFRYTYKTWIHSDHRRRNLSQLQDYVRHCSRDTKSRDRGMWYVETSNYPSLLHSYRHPNDRTLKIGYVGWYSFFGRHIPFRSSWARWLGVELLSRQDTRTRLSIQ